MSTPLINYIEQDHDRIDEGNCLLNLILLQRPSPPSRTWNLKTQQSHN